MSNTPSKLLIRAARADRNKLLAEHDRLTVRYARSMAEARQYADSMAQVKERVRTLNEILGIDDQSAGAALPGSLQATGPAPVGGPVDPGLELLAGPAVRETAVRVLLQQPEHIEALHYKRWYELVVTAGYAITGKNPHAVFLTQLTRSPVIRKSGQSGVYELDREAPLKLRQRIERLRGQLRELSGRSCSEGNAGRIRELATDLEKTERAMGEALRVLRREPVRPGDAQHHQASRLSA